MPTADDALRAAWHPPAPSRPCGIAGPRVLLAGAAGALGAAVLEHLLASRAFAEVGVVVTRPLTAALPGLQPVVWTPDAPPADTPHVAGHRPVAAPRHDTALLVFDRARHANGRELAFLRPEPRQFVALAGWLRARGVRHLLVVQPHAPALLPQALRQGLADLDEHAVAALGFEHLLLMRSAQAADAARAAHPLQRLADWVLSQALLMVPPREQPVPAARVAAFAVRLAVRIASPVDRAPPGTRVVPPEVVWQAAQSKRPGDVDRHARDWLAGTLPNDASVPVQRM